MLILCYNYSIMRKIIQIFIVLMAVLMAENVFALELSSTAFNDGGAIPVKYTCDGANVSPPLAWKDVPEGTKSFVLIVDDPDAPARLWTQWVMHNIPANTSSFPENVQQLPDGTVVGDNSWLKSEYGGPCPGNDQHHYHFKLYALDEMIYSQKDLDRDLLNQAMQRHILAEAELVGVYTS